MPSRLEEKQRRRDQRVATESKLAPPPPPRGRTRNMVGDFPNPRRRVNKFEGLGIVGAILFILLWLIAAFATTAFWVFVILVIGDALNIWNVVGFV